MAIKVISNNDLFADHFDLSSDAVKVKKGVANLEYADEKVKVTLADGTELEAEINLDTKIAAAKAEAIQEAATAAESARGNLTTRLDELEGKKGKVDDTNVVELQSLNGTTLGYLVSSNGKYTA